MDKTSNTPNKQEPTLLNSQAALEAVFPEKNSRPSPRAWAEWRAKGYYPFLKIQKRVWINPVDARRALEARFTIETK